MLAVSLGTSIELIESIISIDSDDSIESSLSFESTEFRKMFFERADLQQLRF